MADTAAMSDLRISAGTIPVLDDHDEAWPGWRDKMESFNGMSGLDDLMKADAARPAQGAEAQAQYDKNNATLYFRLAFFTSGSAHETVKKYKDAKDGVAAWKALVTRYEMEGETKASALHAQLINLTMEAHKDPTVFFLKLEDLQTRLKAMGVMVEDATLKGITMAKMPKAYNGLRTVMDTSAGLTYQQLKVHVKSFYVRNKVQMEQMRVDVDDGVALLGMEQTANGGHGGGGGGKCRCCGKRGNYKRDCPDNVCTFCKKRGHVEKECWKKQKKDAAKEAAANADDDKEESYIVF